jgi:putative ABC transport system permease protein
MTFLKLLNRLVFRTIRQEPFLTVLSVVGVALGIGLFMGVNSASDRAVRSFETNINNINSASVWQISDASGIDFREEIYPRVKSIAWQSRPVLVTNAYLPESRESIDLYGVSVAQTMAFSGADSGMKGEFEDFFKTRNGVAVTRRFGETHHLQRGDSFDVYAYNKRYRLTVVSLIDSAALPEYVAFMDLGNFQEYFNRIGELSRIDIAASDEQAAQIGRILPPNLVIEKKSTVLENQKALLNGFRLNLRFVTFLAVLVGVFLLYNTIFISVVKRRTEIGILRALGTGRLTVLALFTMQGMALGIGGSLLGIVFGRVVAWFSAIAVEKTVTQFYRFVAVPDSSLTGRDAVLALLLGTGASFLSSLGPAYESVHVKPSESWREGTFEQAHRERQTIYSMTGAALILAAGLLVYVDYRLVPYRFPWLSYAGILLFILGCTLNSPAYLLFFLAGVQKPAVRLFRTTSRIALGDMRGSSHRFSLALMSVAVSSALIVAIMSSVYSLKTSLTAWIDTYVSADIYIKPSSCASNFCFYPLAPGIVNAVERLDGVEEIEKFRALQIDFRGRKIIAGFGNSDLLSKHRLGISDRERERLKRLASHREVLISEYLRVAYHLNPGDVIELPTPKGRIPFVVNNASISYSTMSGFMYLDRRWLKEYWGLDDATQIGIYLKKGVDAGSAIARFRGMLGNRSALNISNNRELRDSVLRIFDRSFAITYTIEAIAITISLIGVVNALLILVLERKREIAVLRYLGADWADIRRIMFVSAGMIGVAGILAGWIMGWAISLVITHVINKISFGWEVAFRMPFQQLSLLMLLLFLATLLAGFAPATIARKIDPKAFISFE